VRIEKAIEILEEKQKENEPHWERGDREAVELGIEALKYYDSARERRGATRTMWLPGETTEAEKQG